ncbi:MAG: nucleotidyltransferase family protein [Gammaproteobacteria bacterium]|nr:nucleotidyltransferase family protein [Gammaproteobacteria bacterium]
MKAMILAAGRGTRLAPLTEAMPKPMIPIASEPLIVHQLRWLHRAGIRDVVVNLHHLGDQIRSHIGRGGDFGVRVQYSVEEELLETGGGIRKALPMLGPEPFLVLNGDVWTNYPFRTLCDAAPELAHLVLNPTPAGQAGDFRLDGDSVRRDADGSDTHDLTFCGIAVLQEAIFADAPSGPFSMRDLYFRAAAEGRLQGERFDGLWVDIGTHDQLRRVRRINL